MHAVHNGNRPAYISELVSSVAVLVYIKTASGPFHALNLLLRTDCHLPSELRAARNLASLNDT